LFRESNIKNSVAFSSAHVFQFVLVSSREPWCFALTLITLLFDLASGSMPFRRQVPRSTYSSKYWTSET
ncbi:hypothetical protein, partial [Escherichia coli]|uniref:hypothetical protein n=2 Tax=Escherichia coli TaxID=562 RepID=UPI001BD3DA2D